MDNPNELPQWTRVFTEENPTDDDRIAFIEALDGIKEQAEAVKNDLIQRLTDGEKLNSNRAVAVGKTGGRAKWRDDPIGMMELHGVDADRIASCTEQKIRAISAVRKDGILSEHELETFTTKYPDGTKLVITPLA